MIEHIESLLVPSVYNKIRKSTNDIWNHAKTLPIELSDLVVESDGLYFKFEKVNGELQLLHTFIDTVVLKEGPIINRMIPDAEKKAITNVQLTINLPPNAATVYDLTQDNTGSVITWVENNVQYWRCKSKPILNKNSKSLFFDYNKLTNVNYALSIADTSDIVNMESMFNGCNALTNLDLSGFDTSNVTNMAALFVNCVSLRFIDVSSFNTSNVTNMKQMFYNCSNLLRIEFGSNFVFTAMQYLTNPDSINNTYQMMYHCTASGPWFGQGKFDSNGTFTLNTVTNLMDGPSINNSLNRMTATSFTRSVTPPDMGATVIDISEARDQSIVMWYDATTTTQYWYSDRDVIYMNPNSSSIFKNCSKLTSLDLSMFNTSKVINMDWMFSMCSKMTQLNIWGWDVSNVTSFTATFNGCNALTSLDVSHWDTSKVTSTNTMFYGCTSLTRLDVSRWNMSNNQVLCYTFYYCSKLTSLDLSNWDTSKAFNMVEMFGFSGLLTTITYGPKFTNITLPLTSTDTSNNMSWKMYGNCPANKPNWVGGTWTATGTFIKNS